MISIDTKEQKQALGLFLDTQASFLLLGGAGVGKTSLVKYFQELNAKNILVVAPTGIAAIQAGGQTIHKAFGFPSRPITPKTKVKLAQGKIDLLERIDCLIIDECSMVRADLVDGMDRILRMIKGNKLPFGGTQVIFVGDPYQLPPVVKTSDEESEVLKDFYGSGIPYFFKANVFKRLNLPKIQLQKIYRQSDLTFICALNNIRKGKVEAEDLTLLNTRVIEDNDNQAITLTSLNDTADKINSQCLASLVTQEFCYQGEITGNFNIDSVITPQDLRLKVGAKVLFTRNDGTGRYFNGTMAKVVELAETEIKVALENGSIIAVDKAVWEETKSEYDKETQTVTSQVIGTFEQYPLRLAWSISIHKSQGMTFDEMALDLSHGLFASGQLYVALSRVRTLEGLRLHQEIKPCHIIQNPEINVFAASFNDERMIEDELETSKDIDKHLMSGDFDAAVQNCMVHIKRRIRANMLRDAALLAKKMFDVMLSDDVLIGSTSDICLLKESGTTANFLNAVLCLYDGQYRKAVVFADMVLSQRMCHEALFVKSRALTLLELYDDADGVNMEFNKDEKTNGDGLVDKKWVYNFMLVNSQLGDPVIPFAQRLLEICPAYWSKVILFYRGEMLRKGWAVVTDGNPDEVVSFLNTFNDATVSGSEIVAQLEEMMEKSDSDYLQVISILKSQEWE